MRKEMVRQGLLIGLIVCSLFWVSGPVRGDEWKVVEGPWSWSFPRDHGAHPEYRTEWWYFTGNLRDGAGKQYGYQLTFFRQGIAVNSRDAKNPWLVRDVHLAHFAVSEVTAQRFWYHDRASREGPGLAGARQGVMDVWNLNWTAKMKGDTIALSARHKGLELSLDLRPGKAMVFHGDRGLSRKGPGRGQASYYYSFTDLRAQGSLRTPGLERPVSVTGVSWFDQEFGSNQLGADQVGWDWFSIHLSDGRDLMIYQLRRKDGSIEPASSGTLIEPSGKSTHLSLGDFRLTVVDRWKSARSKGTYPSRWRLEVPKAGIDLSLAVLVPDQELATEGSTGVTYYEGVVGGQGISSGRQVTAEGYVEMTGYAGSLGGVF
jgi:predicted secreted hydrolase